MDIFQKTIIKLWIFNPSISFKTDRLFLVDNNSNEFEISELTMLHCWTLSVADIIACIKWFNFNGCSSLCINYNTKCVCSLNLYVFLYVATRQIEKFQLQSFLCRKVWSCQTKIRWKLNCMVHNLTRLKVLSLEQWWKLNMTKEVSFPATTVKRIGMVWNPFLWPLNILWLCCGRTLVQKLCICSAWLLVFWCLLRSSSSLSFLMTSLSPIPNGCCISWSYLLVALISKNHVNCS